MTKAKKKIQREPTIDVDSLNPDQRKAFDKLCNFLMSPDDSIYVIKGWAGTGKTYCVSLFVKYVLEIVYSNQELVQDCSHRTDQQVCSGHQEDQRN